MTGEGVAYIQAIAASAEDNGFIEKSRLYKIKVRNSINAKITIEYPVLEIVENGEYDVQRYKGVKVNVPDYAMDLIARTLTSYSNDKLNNISDYAFYHNKTLVSQNYIFLHNPQILKATIWLIVRKYVALRHKEEES